MKRILGVSLLLLFCISSLFFARTTVTFMTDWTGPELNVITSIAEQFNSSQNKYTLKVVTVSNLAEKFLTSLAAGNPPDILHANHQYIAPLVAMNAVEPIDDVTKYGANLNEYREEVLKSAQYHNHLYAIPMKLDIFGLFWNKELFEKAGLDPDHPPATLEELKEYAKKLTKRDPNGDIKLLGFDPGYSDKWTWAYVWPYYFGGKVVDEKTGAITANSPICIKSYEWFQDLSKMYGTKEQLEKFVGGYGPYWSASNPFIAGKVAMTFGGDWIAKIIDLYNPTMKWGFSWFPSADGSAKAYTEIDMAVIPKGAKHVKGAKEFLAFLSKPQNLLKFLTPVPILKEEYVKKYEKFMVTYPHRKLFTQIFDKVHLFFAPTTPVWQKYNDFLKSAFLDVIFLRTSPKDALNTVQEKMKRVLQMMGQ